MLLDRLQLFHRSIKKTGIGGLGDMRVGIVLEYVLSFESPAQRPTVPSTECPETLQTPRGTWMSWQLFLGGLFNV